MDDTVTVTLRRSVGLRQPGGGVTNYGPGRVRVPRSFARSLGIKPEDDSQGEAKVAQATRTSEARLNPGNDDPNASTGAGTGEQGADPYKGWLKDDFEAEAGRRNLQVARADGGEGEPLLADYRAALEADDAAKRQQ